MILVLNRNDYDGVGYYVGRPTPLGNPYHIGRCGSRRDVIAIYAVWLDEQLRRMTPAREMFKMLLLDYMRTGELKLICYCAPLACHADVIADRIRQICERVGWQSKKM